MQQATLTNNGTETTTKPREISIALENITVSYRSYKERPTTLKESLIKLVKEQKWRHYSTFNALSNVSFSVEKGKVFGIIGSNGAGKSTLLRVMAGVLPPTTGNVDVVGTVDSLIQLGAGFDLDLNAIENIYLNNSLHQQNKDEIKKRVPFILDFAELQDFATTPIKYYSAGMYARLGFSVAIDRNPDILLVDEILGVGDERFQTKCRKVFDKFLESGKTIVIVTHSMGMLSEVADEVGLLSKGKLIFRGDPKTAIEKYRDEHYQTALG